MVPSSRPAYRRSMQPQLYWRTSWTWAGVVSALLWCAILAGVTR